MPKLNKSSLIKSILVVYLLIILINLFFGTDKIRDAYEQDFNGGICGICKIANDPSICGNSNCNASFGFDIYSLYLSVPIFMFINSIIIRVRKKSLKDTFIISFFSGTIFAVFTELLIKIIRIPVLYTHFMEGRQSLSYDAFSFQYLLAIIFSPFIVFVLLTTVLSISTGNLLGSLILFIAKKIKK